MQAETKVTPSVRVREASFEDYGDISSLEIRYALDTKSYDEWRHLWINNPLYRVLGRDWPIGWVLEEWNGRVVGHLGNIPLWYELNGRQVIAAGTHAWVVDSDYRSSSILLLNQYFRQKRAELFLSTTVSSPAFKAFTLFSSPPVPRGVWDGSLFWITDYSGFALSLVSMKGLPFAKPLSFLLSMAVSLRDLCAGAVLSRRPNRTSRVEVRPCTGFDSRFDIFWEALRKRKPGLLQAVRSRQVLEWHFSYPLLKNELWILTINDSSGLVGYSIFRRQDNPRFGLKRIRLIDFQTLSEDNSFLMLTILMALKRCREEKIHMLEYVGFTTEQDNALQCLVPFRRELPCWLYYYKAGNPALADSLAKPSAWNASCFDGDASL